MESDLLEGLGIEWKDNTSVGVKEIFIRTRKCIDSANDCDFWRVIVNATSNLRCL